MAEDASSSPSLLSKIYMFKREGPAATLPRISNDCDFQPVRNGIDANVIELDDDDDDVKPFQRKKITYCIIDDDDDDDIQEIPIEPVPSVSEEQEVIPVENGVEPEAVDGIQPEAVDDIHEKQVSLDFLEDAFPTKDKMELQDALARSNWNVEQAMARLCEEKFSDTAKRKNDDELQRKKVKKAKKNYRDIEDRTSDIDDEDAQPFKRRLFDSDDSETETTDVSNHDKKKVLEFLSTATIPELKAMSYCSQKKAEAIIEQRPFSSWSDLVEKFQSGKHLGTELLNSAQDILSTRREVKELMKRCVKLAKKLEKAVLEGATGIKEQPELLSDGLKLTAYQMVGLNWLMVLHNQKVNGILADEMGLGKTVQIIAFLAHLKKLGIAQNVPHLIIVPSSTLDNWSNEFERWCPSLRVAVYYGHPDERRLMRVKWIKGGMDDVDVVITTYTVLNSSPEEKKLFRVLEVNYVILDEGHMLKNMTTQRFETLMRINARRRVLLTGTPVQNNLVELMSLLTFLMPNMFAGRKEDLKKIFSKGQKQAAENEKKDQQPQFEQQQIAQARRIMKPFLLRRLKSEVLKDLPKKTESLVMCPMNKNQKIMYDNLVKAFSKAATEADLSEGNEGDGLSGIGMTMDLRKMANHPLLLRYNYTDEQLKSSAAYLARNPSYKGDKEDVIFEDLACMSDFQLHQLFIEFKELSKNALPTALFFESGKFEKFDEILPNLKSEGHRVLIFSQFVIMLDVMEEYLRLRDYSYLRLDGSTQVTFRQELINTFNEDDSIFIFLLSTRAGGMGINLTAADTVIIHDIDFNPYNDKQAEDRCHRVGQSRDVTVIRLISEGTIEEGMLQIAQEKLSLERQINSEDNVADSKNVVCLLKQALGLEARTAGK
ncbi:SWI/SNF-related matrix-associated actin-dependent regulator of chromatin subfamily A containing DEAD/H box 1 homolog isoform X1 [Schistocerca gregaria]|uniref:SWI/SNF-related matrix-associated actin-dependent regulator of chromatin subfamily A containing DEAD/H box 1 homolog isoform X1 n=1 Tax=Schistocerca gregaria TaxID=7010 RepID=UPI00211F2417|nr:SWI/SNF-related matrix-associated actin-dependent regulator of chromatin subfamily A containing DEAD/H box 1 homolog isoform X1 [Schistocerca gregaria]XP_049859001.1 SWI/SNF-related matrix-associated actin-dependent regulator of chromatin subfamily A containing DEAD/H box 1 homolog isoform X1 [Schistocerca gregaria]